MFSSRLKRQMEPNLVSIAIEMRRRSGAELLDLTISNPTQAGLEYSKQEIVAALADERSLIYEPDPRGLLAARRAIAEQYENVPAEQLLLTASSSEAYSYLFKLLCDPGDEVLVPQPSYPLFEFLAELESVHIRHYPLFYDQGWGIDTAALRDAVTSRCRAVVLVNPNNPTGSFLKRAEYLLLAELCSSAGLAIISDEVFADFAFGEDSERVPTLTNCNDLLTFSLNGLSKMAGLPQLKLGWIAVTGPQDTVLAALARLELIADTFLSVNTPVQWAVPRLLESSKPVKEQIRNRTQQNLNFLAGANLRVMKVEAGWYAIVQPPATCSEEQWVLRLIEDCGVLMQPGYFYDFVSEPFLVVSLLTPEDVFREGIRRFILHGSCG